MATAPSTVDLAGLPWGPRALHYTLVFRDKIWVLGGQTIPSTVGGNLAPLHAFVAYGTSGGSEISFTAFLQVK